jgi:hypothetical protein
MRTTHRSFGSCKPLALSQDRWIYRAKTLAGLCQAKEGRVEGLVDMVVKELQRWRTGVLAWAVATRRNTT